jgi:hypothetical protein
VKLPGVDRALIDRTESVLRELDEIADAELHDVTVHGQKYRASGVLVGPTGVAASVVTVWIVLHGEDHPRFVTALPGDRT